MVYYRKEITSELRFLREQPPFQEAVFIVYSYYLYMSRKIPAPRAQIAAIVPSNGNDRPKPANPTRIKYIAKRRKPTFLFSLTAILLSNNQSGYLNL
jgi:hypothetical protein